MTTNDQPPGSAWPMIISNWTYFSLGMGAAILGPALPFLSQGMGIALGDAGILFTAQSLGSLVALVVVGRALDLFDRQAIYLLSLAALALGMVLLPHASIAVLAVGLLVITGLASGSLAVTPTVVVSDLRPQRRIEALSLLYISYAIGALLAPIALGYSLQVLGRIHYSFWGIGVLLAIAMALLLRQPVPRKIRSATAGHRPLAPLLRAPSIWLLSLYVFVYLGSATAFSGWIFTYVRQGPDASDVWATAAASAFWLTLALGRLAGSWLLRWITAEKLLLVAAGGCVFAAFFLLTVQSAALIVVGTLVIGLFYGPMLPTSVGLGQSRHPKASGTTAGLIIGAGSIGTMTIPWLEGKLMAWGGPVWCMVITLISAAFLVALALGILWERRRANDRPGHNARSFAAKP